ncbi:MAG: GNAT family N-acetyltransferase [Thermoguttaceae bacterium]|nr:GNAT family N-acetyltransferase [Thermoguttaceae bacterium]
MMTFDIVRPHPRWLEPYRDMCRVSWGQLHDDYILHDPNDFDRWKGRIFADYRNREAGVGLPPGIVPSATLWLIEADPDGERDECLGVLNLRLHLTEELRRYGGNVGIAVRPDRRGRGIATRTFIRLPELFRIYGIKDEILLTCYADNAPSARAIQKIPGILIEEDVVERNGKPTRILRARWPILR